MSQSIPLSPGPGGAPQEGSTVTITRAVFTQGRPILTDGSSLITTETLVNGLPVAATATPKAGPGDAGTDGKGGQETDGDAEKQPDLTAVPAELPTTFDIEANATKEAVPGSQPLPTPNPGDIDGDPAPSGLSGNGTEAASPDSTAANSKKTPVGAIAGGVVGGILGLAVLLALLFLFLRRRRRPQRVGRSLENEPFVVDDRNERGPETVSQRSGASKKGPKTYSTAQIAEIEKRRQASSGGGNAFVPVVPYKDDAEDKEKLGVAGLGVPERKPSSRGRATVTSVSLTDYDSDDESVESIDEKPKLDKGKGKAKLPSVCLSVSSREEV